MSEYTLVISFEDSSSSLHQQLSKIPKECTHLKLRILRSYNYQYNETDLALLFRSESFPQSITTLEIDPTLDLRLVQRILPKNIQKIVVGGKDFDRYFTPAIIEILRKDRSDLKTVDLSNNYLYLQTGNKLVEFMQSIGKPEVLILRSNQLGQLPVQDIVRTMSVVPASVKTLVISDNQLDKLTAEELAQVIAAIPATVESIVIGMNGLDTFENPELFFKAIKPNVNFLNVLGTRNAKFLAALPESIKTVRFSPYYVKQDDQQLILSLPDSVKYVQYDEKTLSVEAFKILKSTNFESHLNIIQKKLNSVPYTSSLHSPINKLANDLNKAQDNYIFNKSSQSQFITECNKAIDLARPILEEHRGWSKLLREIASALISIASLGIVNYVAKSSFLGIFAIPKTDSAVILENVANSINPKAQVAV